MSKAYTEQTAALKTVTHDTTVLDSQKILVYPGEGARSERKNILTIINEKDNLIKSEVSALDTRLDDAEVDIDELVAGVATLESKNYAYTDTANVFNETNIFAASNTFQEVNNFQKHVNFGSSVETNGTVRVNSGGVVLSADGYVSFNDDGLVTTPSGAKGYPYSEGIPTVLSNGGVYNLGIITEPIDISGVYFDGDDTIIQTCEVWFEQGSAVKAITWMPDLYWIDTANGKAPTWISKLRYRVAIRKEIDRLIGSVSYSYSI